MNSEEVEKMIKSMAQVAKVGDECLLAYAEKLSVLKESENLDQMVLVGVMGYAMRNMIECMVEIIGYEMVNEVVQLQMLSLQQKYAGPDQKSKPFPEVCRN